MPLARPSQSTYRRGTGILITKEQLISRLYELRGNVSYLDPRTTLSLATEAILEYVNDKEISEVFDLLDTTGDL